MHETLRATDEDLQQHDAMLNYHGACLLAAFEGALKAVNGMRPAASSSQALTQAQLEQVRKQLSGAVLHLQFQDISSQLLEHCQTRLQACQAQLSQLQQPACAPTAKPVLAALKGPVTHSSLEAGSIDLFELPANPPSKDPPNEC